MDSNRVTTQPDYDLTQESIDNTVIIEIGRSGICSGYSMSKYRGDRTQLIAERMSDAAMQSLLTREINYSLIGDLEF